VPAFEADPPDRLATVYDFREVAVGTLTVGPFTVTSARMQHPGRVPRLRLEAGGRVLAYSADTGATPRLVELARDADVFLCEASWPEAPDLPGGLHLTGREAGEHAAQAEARAPAAHAPHALGRPGRDGGGGEGDLRRPARGGPLGSSYDV
jgi:hypothetical protein